jgi:hypothetical protein
MRITGGAVALVGVLLVLVHTGKEDPRALLLAVAARKEKPYPYPVAYRFGFNYREESVREGAWQAEYYARNLGGRAAVGLARFYPPYPDTEPGAVASWRERRQAMPFVYLDPRSKVSREPTELEKDLECAGWVAGYLESARRHPVTD